jgi:LDH2 family malate/lactate/ureidoglycolate dehydrogenase
VPATAIHRYRFDELRRFAAALATAGGLAPARALALASHVLWFDAAGAPSIGISSLPGLLEALATGQVDPKAEGRVVAERAALVVLDGQNGVPLLLLERASELAIEKARETAVGVVRLTHVRCVCSAAALTAAMAVGPMAGLAIGPSGAWSMALPSDSGLPLVLDSGLRTAGLGGPRRTARTATETTRHAPSFRDATGLALAEGLGLAAELLVGESSWLVAAVSVPALEPLASFQQRIASASHGVEETPAMLPPDRWNTLRRETREQGVLIAGADWKPLDAWAERLGVPAPTPIGH